MSWLTFLWPVLQANFYFAVLRMKLNIQADFEWVDRSHGNVAESFWIWVEDPESNFIYHHEFFTILKKQVISREPRNYRLLRDQGIIGY